MIINNITKSFYKASYTRGHVTVSHCPIDWLTELIPYRSERWRQNEDVWRWCRHLLFDSYGTNKNIQLICPVITLFETKIISADYISP